ncbi:hypothetical protein NW768_007964 [Fusarium equiseti]|uniref:Uncharacterized protein n=1 Tax=Fusarium equiseti TaxID=61235 RepID=A0ABQ8R5E6_FUSEQ|nr:hypothetical protein NW768_007964 [Fusarium equiseti]
MSLPSSLQDQDRPSQRLLLKPPENHMAETQIRCEKLSPWRKMSILTIAVLLMSLLAMMGAAGFLAFLWSYPTGHNPNSAWLCIVSKNWALPLVTTTTLVIRLAAAYQAAVCTSMLASIILERRSVTTDGSVKLSVVRASNAAPLTLLESLYGNFQGATLWGIVVFFLTITTSALQSASTALVRDMGIGQLVREEQDIGNLAALSWDNHNLSAINDMQRERYWLETVEDFPTFAERRSPFVTNARETKTIRDTGLVHRAFLPFRNATVRTSIRCYKSLSTVVDSRVACVQPRIHDGLGVAFVEGWGWYLNGTFVPNDMPEGMIGDDSAGSTPDMHNRTLDATLGKGPNTTLTRAQELPYTHEAGEWNIITKIMYSGPKLLSALDPRYRDIVHNKTLSFERGERSSYRVIGDDIALLTGRSYLLINITSAMGRRAIVNETDTTNPRNFYFSPRKTKHKLMLKGQDEWLTFRLSGVPTFRLAVSLCFDSFVSVEANVSITSPSDRPMLGRN